MNVLVAGAGGAVGARLTPKLIEAGHDVVALTRSERKASALRELGAQPVATDLLDRVAVLEAVSQAAPEVIIHQATSLAGVKSLRNFDREFALTNRLRTEGTDHLLEAARAVGARRLIAQSYGNWNYERTGEGLKSEEDPLDPNPPKKQVTSLAAIRHLERAVLEDSRLDGVVLRYGNFYGPGTDFSEQGEIVRQLRRRQFPIVGTGAGVWAFVHIEDAASATVAAIDGPPGTYNIVDDDPRPVQRPSAGQRGRGRRRRSGGLPAPQSRPEHGDRIAQGLPGHRHDQAGARRAALGALTARAVRRRVAAGARADGAGR